MCAHDLPDVRAGVAPSGRAVYCDPCIRRLVAALIEGGFHTRASCCGHGHLRPIVTWTDPDGTDRHVVVFDTLEDALAAANPNRTDIHGVPENRT